MGDFTRSTSKGLSTCSAAKQIPMSHSFATPAGCFFHSDCAFEGDILGCIRTQNTLVLNRRKILSVAVGNIAWQVFQILLVSEMQLRMNNIDPAPGWHRCINLLLISSVVVFYASGGLPCPFSHVYKQ